MDRDQEREAEDLLRLLPPIRRSRLWRLYAEERSGGKGRRFLDLWMDGGRSLLGAKGTGLGTLAKAAIDMGLTRPAPSVWERRLEKALLEAYPGYEAVRFYRSEEGALAALAAFLDLDRRALRVLDPAALGGPASGGFDASILRPFAEFLPGSGAAAGAAFALPLLGCPAAFAPGILLARQAGRAPRGELVAPLQLACASRAMSELKRLLPAYGEELWKRSDRRLGPYFERRGPYLYPRHPASGHGDFFRRALASGLLVSPLHGHPSILPPDFDDGELAALAKHS